MRQLRGDLQRVVGVAAVAAGVAGDHFERIVVSGQLQRAETALTVFQGSPQQRGDLFVGERFEHIDAAAREQRRNNLKGRILGRCADQPDGAALDVGQKGVLLRLVEAVNLIDEQDGARVHLRGLRGGDHHLLDLLDAAHHGGKLDEGGLGGLGDDLGQRGLAHSRRTPQNHGAGPRSVELVAFDLHAQRFAGANQVLLAAQLIQRARAHPLCQWRGAQRALRAFRFAVKKTHRALPVNESVRPILTASLSLRLGGEVRLSARCREAS